MTFDHIGIFVPDLAEGRRMLAAIVPIESWSEDFEDPLWAVRICFGATASGFRYELIAPFGTPNPVSGALAAGKNLLNHLAYLVADIDAAADDLRATGAVPMGPARPAVAFAGARVMFFLTALGFIMELIEEPAG